LVHVPPQAQALDMEQSIVSLRHELHRLPMFSDDALAALIDNHPREDLHVHTMSGTNESPSYLDADIGSLSGKDVLAAIQRGKIWLSVVHVEDAHSEYAELLDEMYAGLEAQSTIRTVKGTRLANLLISSPTAEVFYHADAQPNVLWHIRGRKKLMVYPPWDPQFLSAENRELCLLGMLMDDVYSTSHDLHAVTFDMSPGDAATWPQSTPHRVVNVEGLNISISSEHHTHASKRRQQVAAANWFFRHRFGLPTRSLSLDGPVPLVKRGAYVACRVAGKLLGRRSLVPRDPEPPVSIRLDPRDPRGYVECSG
jgi:hypothetical protein